MHQVARVDQAVDRLSHPGNNVCQSTSTGQRTLGSQPGSFGAGSAAGTRSGRVWRREAAGPPTSGWHPGGSCACCSLSGVKPRIGLTDSVLLSCSDGRLIGERALWGIFFSILKNYITSILIQRAWENSQWRVKIFDVFLQKTIATYCSKSVLLFAI